MPESKRQEIEINDIISSIIDGEASVPPKKTNSLIKKSKDLNLDREALARMIQQMDFYDKDYELELNIIRDKVF